MLSQFQCRRKGAVLMTFLFAFGQKATGFVQNSLIASSTRRLPSISLSNSPFCGCVWKGDKYGHYFRQTVAFSLSPSPTPNAGADATEIEQRIAEKGAEIRELKSDGISKDDLAPHVAELLALKEQANPDAGSKRADNAPKKETNTGGRKQGGEKQRDEFSDSEIRQVRLEKARAMEEAGQTPYAYSFNPTHTAAELHCIYDGKLDGGEEDENADVAVAGRIMTRRVFGKLAFFTLLDESGTIQLQLEKKRLGDSFKVS